MGWKNFFRRKRSWLQETRSETSIAASTISRSEGIQFFSLDEKKKTVLGVGGSLGAKSINEAIDKGLDELLKAGLQLIWQTGKPYAAESKGESKWKEISVGQ